MTLVLHVRRLSHCCQRCRHWQYRKTQASMVNRTWTLGEVGLRRPHKLQRPAIPLRVGRHRRQLRLGRRPVPVALAQPGSRPRVSCLLRVRLSQRLRVESQALRRRSLSPTPSQRRCQWLPPATRSPVDSPSLQVVGNLNWMLHAPAEALALGLVLERAHLCTTSSSSVTGTLPLAVSRRDALPAVLAAQAQASAVE